MKVILVTDQSWRFGQKNVLPIVGEVQISEDGKIEVDEDKAQQLIDLQVGFVKSKEKIQETTTTTTTLQESHTTTTLEEIKKVEEDTLSSEEKVDTIEPQVTSNEVEKAESISLENLTMDKLKELASPFPKEEWSKFTKKADLIAYLHSK